MAQTTLKNIAAMLESGKISQAISSLHMLIGQADTASNPNLPVLSQTLREAETVYSSMLRFFAQGMPDPSAGIFSRMCARCCILWPTA